MVSPSNKRKSRICSSVLNRCNVISCIFLATGYLTLTIDSVAAQIIIPSNNGLIGIDLDGNGTIDVPTGVTVDGPPEFTPEQGIEIETNLQPTPNVPTSPAPGLVTSYPQNRVPPRELSQRIAKVDEDLTTSYQYYIGELEEETSEVSLAQIQQDLTKIEEEAGIKPAVIYAVFYPSEATLNSGQVGFFPQPDDELELILVTAKGDAVRRRIKGTDRAQVTAAANRFSDSVFYGLPEEKYLPPSQQLYQWLIEPLREELKAREIENLVFILDSGIRSLPLAALHDGEEYLIEKYSVGMIPSFRLTNTKYQDIRDVEILAMGADNFADPELSPLPAVPTELDIIAQSLWEGESFLNEDFTVENLQQTQTNQPFGILHLATHAEFLPGKPSNSFIQFGDRKLGIDEVRQLGLNNPLVQLIVLSACNTAVGDRDAEYGFASLAYQAGVKSALGSLWYVSDSGTLSLMSQFYRELKSSPIKAEALRQAQLSLLNEEVRLEKGKLIVEDVTFDLPAEITELDIDLTHPRYWSAFTIIGNPW
ncbi:hypothetical protein Xen7305DRAFT_00022880 [Xenococcus sp. PCC 7305]|uniref:CHAT domain-containing protein n=1 Tax=Xenococcus sp. PCC 7305 TaxID=102125 RepID=UPI0002AC826F|nr:CHAT domain-containing protein [Xenococcus sp. PCC 7305]ELS02573.1 hypothetical protein Xen7305DRAFT_00022880 [Xenococcus sp. PCC 7305]